jgi:hypothetical protein
VAGSVLPPGLRRSATPPSHARSRRSADRPCHGRRTVGAPDPEGPGLRPHLEGSHPDPPRANGVRASRPSSDFEEARIHPGTPGEHRLWTCLPPVRCNLGLPIGAVGRHRVQTVSEPLGGDYHGAARVAPSRAGFGRVSAPSHHRSAQQAAVWRYGHGREVRCAVIVDLV